VIVSLFLGSAAVLSNAQDNMKEELRKTLLVRSVIAVFGIFLVVGICYMVYKLHYTRTCPGKPRDECPSGYTPVCDGATNYTWACSQTGSACGNYPIKCAHGPAECDPDTLVWECPDATKCPDKPSDFKCPATVAGVPHKAHCSQQTKYEWLCDPYCSDKPPSTLSCPSDKHPGCHVNTNYQWQCVDASDDVCGRTSHPDCEGALCIDRDGGWDWVCPGDLTKADIQWYKGIDCVDMPDGDADGKTINVCFTDSSKQTAIAPLVGEKCKAQDASGSIGKDLDNAVNNPRGNISDGKVYKFDPDKHMYYQPDEKRQTQCILAYDHTGCEKPDNGVSIPCCQNGSVFHQDKAGISETGHCVCLKDTAGDSCQYTRSTTCNGNGTPADDGSCTCDTGYMNAVTSAYYQDDPEGVGITVGQCNVAGTDTCYSQHPNSPGGYCFGGEPPIYTARCDTLEDPSKFKVPWTGDPDTPPPRGKVSIDYSVPLGQTGYCDT
jgi:hypothetical protein